MTLVFFLSEGGAPWLYNMAIITSSHYKDTEKKPPPKQSKMIFANQNGWVIFCCVFEKNIWEIVAVGACVCAGRRFNSELRRRSTIAAIIIML